MAKISKDLAAGTLHPREALFIAGNLGALNAEVITPADGCNSVTIDLRGTFSMTVEISGSIDGTNWSLIPVRPLNQAAVAYVSAIAGTAAGIWTGSASCYRFVRARVTAYTSGTAIATLSAGTCTPDETLQGKVTPLVVTATGAAAAAVTATLASPGAGLRHYITYITIVRSASVALTAGAAPTVVTTTNLPGSLAFTFGADAALQGGDKIIREDFAFPLASSAQGTATTIVCPATTGAIWRITVGYYIAP
jgi:hypothetical protein